MHCLAVARFIHVSLPLSPMNLICLPGVGTVVHRFLSPPHSIALAFASLLCRLMSLTTIRHAQPRAVILFNLAINGTNLLGIGLTILGGAYYSYIEYRSKAKPSSSSAETATSSSIDAKIVNNSDEAVSVSVPFLSTVAAAGAAAAPAPGAAWGHDPNSTPVKDGSYYDYYYEKKSPLPPPTPANAGPVTNPFLDAQMQHHHFHQQQQQYKHQQNGYQHQTISYPMEKKGSMMSGPLSPSASPLPSPRLGTGRGTGGGGGGGQQSPSPTSANFNRTFPSSSSISASSSSSNSSSSKPYHRKIDSLSGFAFPKRPAVMT